MSKSITWKELLRKHGPLQHHPPYGDCIVVPGDEFDPDFEGLLCDQGYSVVFVEIKGEKVTLVYKSTEGAEEKSEEPDPKTSKQPDSQDTPYLAHSSYSHPKERPRSWSEDEDALLLREWPNQKGTFVERAKALVPLLPGRNSTAIYQRHWRLTSKPQINLKKDPKVADLKKKNPKIREAQESLSTDNEKHAEHKDSIKESICPLIDQCQELVDELTADLNCHGLWQACEFTQHILVKKKPREWDTSIPQMANAHLVFIY